MYRNKAVRCCSFVPRRYTQSEETLGWVHVGWLLTANHQSAGRILKTKQKKVISIVIVNYGLSEDKVYPSVTLTTHWGQVTHLCVINLTIICSDNGLSPGRRHAIIWTNAGILSIGTLETNFSEILIEILTFSFKNMRLKVSSGKWRSFCLGPNVLIFFAWHYFTVALWNYKENIWICEAYMHH